MPSESATYGGLQTEDLDRRRGTLRVVRQGRDFLVVLDELVLQMITDWLRVRATRWPATNNPHLLISGHTAHNRSPMSRFGLEASFRRLGITANQLRTDRIIDEARHTADPVQLIRVFGLGITSAIRYVRAAHPETVHPGSRQSVSLCARKRPHVHLRRQADGWSLAT